MDYKKLKEKYLIHKKQKKYHLSVLDWTPYFDWYFNVHLFFIILILIGFIGYGTYIEVNRVMNDVVEFSPRRNIIPIEEINNLKERYQDRERVLNSLR